jgi:hypothetical protein
MTAPHILDPAGLLTEALGEASPDLMRSLLQTMIGVTWEVAVSLCGRRSYGGHLCTRRQVNVSEGICVDRTPISDVIDREALKLVSGPVLVVQGDEAHRHVLRALPVVDAHPRVADRAGLQIIA